MLRTLLTLAALALVTASPAHATSTSDPQSDVAARSVDLTAFSARSSGRGVAFAWKFAVQTPTPSSRYSICARLQSGGHVCIGPSFSSVRLNGRKLDGRITRPTPQTVRVWVRAPHVGIARGELARARGVAQYVAPSGVCTSPCVDVTGWAAVRYLSPSSCQHPSGAVKYANGSRAVKLIALTFDDGPSSYTSSILNHLRDAKAPGTFYMNGVHMSSYPGVMRRMRAEGHELANHSWGHESLPSTSSMSRTNDKIRQVSGYKPCTFRPPYGAVNSSLVARAGALGMATIIWDVDTRDWEHQDTGRITSIATAGHNGSIVLMHDGGGPRSATVAAVPGIIASYRSRGYQFVTVDELLGMSVR